MEPFLHIHNDWRKMWHYCLYTLMIFEPWIWQHGQAGISCSSYEEAIFLCFKRLFAGIHIFKNKKINPDQSKQEQNISVIKALTHDWQLGKGKYKRSIFKVEQVERGLKQAEVDGRRKAEEVQTVKNKVGSAHLYVTVWPKLRLLRVSANVCVGGWGLGVQCEGYNIF